MPTVYSHLPSRLHFCHSLACLYTWQYLAINQLQHASLLQVSLTFPATPTSLPYLAAAAIMPALSRHHNPKTWHPQYPLLYPPHTCTQLSGCLCALSAPKCIVKTDKPALFTQSNGRTQWFSMGTLKFIFLGTNFNFTKYLLEELFITSSF